MMKKNYWIKCVAAVAICITAASCTKIDGNAKTQEFTQNFNALVMGGKDIDPTQDWNTVGNIQVKINVDFGNEQTYRVYILQAPPVLMSNAAYIGMALVKSGESKTISVTKPANCGLLYAACYDASGHAMCQPFQAKATGTEVSFNGKSPILSETLPSSSGNPWSVDIPELPDLSAYTTGNLVEASEAEQVEMSDEVLHIKISTPYNGFVPCLGLYRNKSIYVTNTWELSFNQQVAYGNAIVIGEGGTLNVPRQFTLSTAPSDEEANGLIYVLPGGKITGDGIVEFVTSEGTFCYNAGNITAKSIQINGGTLVNAGTIGDPKALTSSITSDKEITESSLLINCPNANIALQNIDSEELNIDNAGYLKTSDNLTLNKSMKCDDGSYIECASLTLNGNSDGSCVLYLGNAACVNCLGNISIDNFGVWGPSGDDFTANAIFKVKNCTSCTTTEGVKGTYLLDHVELILPSTFPTVFSTNALNVWAGNIKGVGIGSLQPSFIGYQNLRMFYYWMNGYEGKMLNPDNYQWDTTSTKYNLVWNSSLPIGASGIDASRQTCTYSTSASYDYAHFDRGTTAIPEAGGVFYAFETPENSLRDFDYNDVVLFVNTPTDDGNGYTSLLQIMAVGNTVKTHLLYNGEPRGYELHQAAGGIPSATINTTTITRSFQGMGTISVEATTKIDQLPFTLTCEDAEGNTTSYKPTMEKNEAPLYLVINGDKEGKWFWAKEDVNIGVAYPQFSTWASNTQSYIDWYDRQNASSKVITY